MEYKWILASGSPRRKEILSEVLPEFTIKVSNADENYTSTEPEEIVKELALIKAGDIADSADNNTIIISADTVVAIDGKILGKPNNRENCKEMLLSLSGRAHKVYTGVAITCINNKEKIVDVFSECTDVYVDELSDEEIENYMDTVEPYDKAGGYGIQGIFAKHILKINGDYLNVVGFPLNHFYRIAKNRGYIG